MIVREFIADQIRNCKGPDVPLMSERELCIKFNVTRPLVRKAFEVFFNDGLLIVKRGKGVFVKKRSYSNAWTTIPKVYKILYFNSTGRCCVGDNFYMEIMERVCSTLKNYPVHLELHPLIGEPGSIIKEISMFTPDGILWCRPTENIYTELPEIRKICPVCTFGDTGNPDPFSVALDHEKAGYDAAEWFLARGMKRVLHVGHKPDSARNVDFYRGWCAAFADHGSPADEMLLIRHDDYFAAKFENLPAFESIFSRAASYPGIDECLRKAGKHYTVMLDNYCRILRNPYNLPAAVIQLMPEKVMASAVEYLMQALTNPYFIQEKFVIHPEITVMNGNMEVKHD